MAEPALATKLPENDALEDQQDTSTLASASLIQGDTPAQSGASMGDHCTTDRPISTASTQAPSGELTTFDSVAVYVSKPVDYPHSPSKLLLLLTGGTGVHSLNNQLQADKFAAAGYVVVMPDQFAGDPAPNSAPANTADPNPSLIEQVKLRAAETAKSFMIDMWLARHTAEKVMPIVLRVLGAAKDEYADAVANGGGVYAAGYCFGAKYVIMLAGEQQPDAVTGGPVAKDEEAAGAAESKAPLIKVGAIAHGTLVTREDMTGIKAPMSMVCVENDQLFPDDILEVGRKHLESSKIEHEIKTYPGVPHGFAVVGEYPDPKIQTAQTAAFDQMLAWLQRF